MVLIFKLQEKRSDQSVSCSRAPRDYRYKAKSNKSDDNYVIVIVWV